MMARKIIHDGPVNQAVMAWMRANGIEPKDVRGYTLTMNAGEPATIDVRIFMTDELPTSSDEPERIMDADGDWFVRIGPNTYSLKTGGGMTYSREEIEREYGIEKELDVNGRVIGAN